MRLTDRAVLRSPYERRHFCRSESFMAVFRCAVPVCREQRVRSIRRRAAAAVGSRECFEHMTVGIFEVDPAAAIPLVDLVPLGATGIGPIGQVPFPNAREDLVEFGLGYQKGVMLGNDLAIGASVLFNIHIIERGVTYRYDRKRP